MVFDFMLALVSWALGVLCGVIISLNVLHSNVTSIVKTHIERKTNELETTLCPLVCDDVDVNCRAVATGVCD